MPSDKRVGNGSPAHSVKSSGNIECELVCLKRNLRFEATWIERFPPYSNAGCALRRSPYSE
jgi:hypothetical protein